MERRTGLGYRAVRCIIAEVNEETLLHVDSSNAHDGGKEQQQVGDQLHDCCIVQMWRVWVRNGGVVQRRRERYASV